MVAIFIGVSAIIAAYLFIANANTMPHNPARFAVMGNPIAHSKSPIIQQALAAQCGVAMQYNKLLVAEDGFAEAVMLFFANGGTGLNITLPFKEQAYQLAVQHSEQAQAAGAVNTLKLNSNGQLFGHNTDGIGLVGALQQLTPLAGQRILIIGAGGAARGVILPLLQAHVAHIAIYNRTASKAADLVTNFCQQLPAYQQQLQQQAHLNGQFDIVINASSAALVGGEDYAQYTNLSFNVGFEMAYGKDTHFTAHAKQIDAKVADGIGMLIGQAVESFAWWHGVRPQPERIDWNSLLNITPTQ